MYSLVSPSHPLLKQKVWKLGRPTLEAINIAHEMNVIMKVSGGIGIAANQVGVNMTIFLVEPSIVQKEFGKAFPDKICIYFDPLITYYSLDTYLTIEGCLSRPGESCCVRRHREIHLSYLSTGGLRMTLTATGRLAQVIQHEVDHLNGLCITDLEQFTYEEFRNERSANLTTS